MDCVLSGSLLAVFSLFCYAMCVFVEQLNSLSLSLSLSIRSSVSTEHRLERRTDGLKNCSTQGRVVWQVTLCDPIILYMAMAYSSRRGVAV